LGGPPALFDSIRRLLRSIPSRFFMVTCLTLAHCIFVQLQGTPPPTQRRSGLSSLCPRPTVADTHVPFRTEEKKVCHRHPSAKWTTATSAVAVAHAHNTISRYRQILIHRNTPGSAHQLLCDAIYSPA
jgi:hypothetical protein